MATSDASDTPDPGRHETSEERDDRNLAELLQELRVAGLLTAPVAYHRLVFRHHRKERRVRWGNSMALAGLACVTIAAVAIPFAFASLWFVVPVVSRGEE